jgi:hypothetical protein
LNEAAILLLPGNGFDMEIAGRGRILVWEGASLWVLEAPAGIAQTDFHSHHAIQITLALEGEFELRTAGQRLGGPAVAVAADASHVFHASGVGAFLFLEPESKEGRPLPPPPSRTVPCTRWAALPSPIIWPRLPPHSGPAAPTKY